MNGDGLDDIYIGGAAGHPGQLYLQTADGTFIKKDRKDFRRLSDFEDGLFYFLIVIKMEILILLVCPGGNNFPAIQQANAIEVV